MRNGRLAVGSRPNRSPTLKRSVSAIRTEIAVHGALRLPDAAIARLRRQHLIEGRKPRFRVGAAIAAATDSKARYISTKALDDKHYEGLITGYLAEFGTASRSDIDAFLVGKLGDELSDDEKYRRISTLLTKLRRAGAIENVGTRKHSQWQLVS